MNLKIIIKIIDKGMSKDYIYNKVEGDLLLVVRREKGMTLLRGKIGSSYIVEDIDLEPSIKRRLEMLGLTNGTKVEILNSKKNGSIIIKVRGTRFAIGKEIASGIVVEGDVV